MSDNSFKPNFGEFTRWLVAKRPISVPSAERYEALLLAARGARDEFLQSQQDVLSVESGTKSGRYHLEVLQLLAAADNEERATPPEMTTARGFRVSLVYDEGVSPEYSSICVLVQSPPEMIEQVQGETAYLWNGAERFELGQFDSDGKAIGTLPAGLQITMSDFAMGRVKLEEPNPPDGG